MRIYGTYQTCKGLDNDENTPCVDFLTFEFKENHPDLKKIVPDDLKPEGIPSDDYGPELTATWDKYSYTYDENTGEGKFVCNDIHLGKFAYANGLIDLFKHGRVREVQFYAPRKANPAFELVGIPFRLTSLYIKDGSEEYDMPLESIDYPELTIDIVTENREFLKTV